MAQVKFYSVSSLPNSPDAGGVFFVNGGELYKGASRFGANKVFTVPGNTDQTAEGFDLASALTAAGVSAENANAIGGDILTGFGAAKVFNGTTWVDLGQDQAALDEQLEALVSGLAFNGEGSYITGITQGADGKVSASVSNFATDVKTAIGNGAASSTANGITVSVTTTSGSVTGVQVAATDISANSGTFTDLTVTSTATFSATTVSATTLTIGGSTVEQLADKQIAAIASHTETSTALGITVSVTTSAGSVSGVYVDATSFGNAMHFVGVKASTGEVTEPASGDIIVIGSEPASGFVAGQEYIYDGTNWELIGDQATYATKAAVEASWNTLGTAAFVDTATTVAADATTLPTGGAVASYVSSVIDGLAGSASDVDKGVTVEVVTADGEVSTVDVAVTAASTMALNATGSADELATTAAIKSFYDNNLVWLDANGAAI